MLSEEKSMAIKRGNLLVAPDASGYRLHATGSKRFLERFSGRRRHVRRTPGTPAAPDVDDACCKSSTNTDVGIDVNVDVNTDAANTDASRSGSGSGSSRRKFSHIEDDELPPNVQQQQQEQRQRRNGVPGGATLAHATNSPTRDAADTETAATTAPYFRRRTLPPYIATILIITCTLFGIADACSSRSTPKPRPPTPTPRPNITFHMYTCPPDYAEWYCLNGATCFTVKIAESLLYNCLCANGYIGQRCEFKDLDGSYLPSRQRVMLETASIAGGATIAVFLVVIICIAAYIHCKRKQKELRTSNGVDTVDGPGRDPELRPFSNHGRSLRIFMAKNSNALTSPAIEQTKMPGWNYSSPESTRMASISEGKSSHTHQ
ncbi:uncharacterized protein LOC105690420 isoform X2 [Athalia rosae]|uniref:uncharacterized protein LOC105690420 isoform X2 n=1 Tax=Athalia rosae TaxID=37344 RepID=UPI0020342BC4|nr:uncharacterized protein LOC105690420 isoform X2 [Athalia rosae]